MHNAGRKYHLVKGHKILYHIRYVNNYLQCILLILKLAVFQQCKQRVRSFGGILRSWTYRWRCMVIDNTDTDTSTTCFKWSHTILNAIYTWFCRHGHRHRHRHRRTSGHGHRHEHRHRHRHWHRHGHWHGHLLQKISNTDKILPAKQVRCKKRINWLTPKERLGFWQLINVNYVLSLPVFPRQSVENQMEVLYSDFHDRY